MYWQGNGGGPQRPLRITNEFAGVTVRLVPTHNGDDILEIRDVKHGVDIRLDALELEALTRLSPDDLAVLVDPSRPGIAKPAATASPWPRGGQDDDIDGFDSDFDFL